MSHCEFCLNENLWDLTENLYKEFSSEMGKINSEWDIDLIDLIDDENYNKVDSLDDINKLFSYRGFGRTQSYQIKIKTGIFSSEKINITICDNCEWWLDEAQLLLIHEKINSLKNVLYDEDGNPIPEIENQINDLTVEASPLMTESTSRSSNEEKKIRYLKDLIDNRDSNISSMENKLVEYIDIIKPKLKEFERLFLLYNRDLSKSIIQILEEVKSKIGAKEIEERINLYGNVDIIRDTAEKLYIDGKIKRTDNYRYYLN